MLKNEVCSESILSVLLPNPLGSTWLLPARGWGTQGDVLLLNKILHVQSEDHIYKLIAPLLELPLVMF